MGWNVSVKTRDGNVVFHEESNGLICAEYGSVRVVFQPDEIEVLAEDEIIVILAGVFINYVSKDSCEEIQAKLDEIAKAASL